VNFIERNSLYWFVLILTRKSDWTKEEIQRKYVDTMTAQTLPVNVKMEGQTHIHDFWQVEKLLTQAQLISLTKCDCRKKVQGCDNPLDVCISLDREAELLIAKGNARKVTLDEALALLRKSHEAGLVHISYTDIGDPKPFVICSCCACCCHSLAGLMRFQIPDAIVATDYIAVQDDETCIACGNCVNRCYFQARSLLNGTLIYDESKCFGCGVCVSTCPTSAISLRARSGVEAQKD
jgi:NAD-dependent dihydropyrimidine dehydrogenase PreA subunit